MKGVLMTKMVQEQNLTNLTPEIDLSDKRIMTAEINRPALQLTGYLEHFANERVQIIGYVEYTYLMQLPDDKRLMKYERFISSKIPCVIFSTMTKPSQDMLDLAVKYNSYFCYRKNNFQPYGRDHPLAGRTACALYFYSWCAGRCFWRGNPDHRRERNREKRGCSGADQTRPPSCQ